MNIRGTDSQTDKTRTFLKATTGFIVPARKEIKRVADSRIPEIEHIP